MFPLDTYEAIDQAMRRPWSLSFILSVGIWAIGGGSLWMCGISSSTQLVKAVLPPLLAVLMIGIVASDHWWTRGTFLIGAPPLFLGLWLVVTSWGDANGASSSNWGLFLAGVGAICIAAAMMAAALGVIMGKRLRRAKDAWRGPGDAAG
jgi:hypothetical protein